MEGVVGVEATTGGDTTGWTVGQGWKKGILGGVADTGISYLELHKRLYLRSSFSTLVVNLLINSVKNASSVKI